MSTGGPSRGAAAAGGEGGEARRLLAGGLDARAAEFEGLLGRKLIEQVRLGIAQINQCQNCLLTRYPDSIEDGLTEEMVRALPGAQDSPLFTEREKAAIEFGQKMARDHFSVGDEDYIRLHQHFSEQEVVELCLDVAMFVGLGRLFATIDARNTVCVIPAAAKTA
jgi:alkylhydroperoxidase family enzyme